MILNQAVISGRLARSPELKSLPSGMTVASFTLVTSRVWKDKSGSKQEAPDFHNIVVFGNQAEAASRFLKKGQLCLIVGRLQTRSWDGKDGQKQYRTEIVAQTVQFGPRSAKEGVDDVPADDGNQDAPVTRNEPTQPAKTYVQPRIEYPEEEINPEDIPF